MKRLLFIAICFCMALSVSAGKKKDFVDYSYELTYVKDVPASTVGFTVFKVWSYGKKKELLTKDICMRNAVHGLLFKGLAANYSGKQGNVPPLCPEGYQAHKSTLTASSIRANTASTYNLQAVAHSLPVMLSKARKSGRLVCSCRSISKNCANAWRRMAL